MTEIRIPVGRRGPYLLISRCGAVTVGRDNHGQTIFYPSAWESWLLMPVTLIFFALPLYLRSFFPPKSKP